MEDVFNVIIKNKIYFDRDLFEAQSNRIMLCTLLLLHNTSFDFKGHKLGSCVISPENHSISHNARFVDADGKAVEHKESFGKLQITGNVVLNKEGKDLAISHTIRSARCSIRSRKDTCLIRMSRCTSRAVGCQPFPRCMAITCA